MSVKRLRRKLHSPLCRCLHHLGAAMARNAVRTGDQFQRAGPLMFLVARRTRAVLHDTGFVECVRPTILLKMTSVAFLVDRFERDAVTKTISQHGPKC